MQLTHKPMIYLLKEKIEYVTGLWGYVTGVAMMPYWMDLITSSVFGVIFATVTVVVTFFVKKWLEANFNNIFKNKK